MSGDEIVKIVQILAVAIPATIAAVSSMRNGVKIDQNAKKIDEHLANGRGTQAPSTNGQQPKP